MRSRNSGGPSTTSGSREFPHMQSLEAKAQVEAFRLWDQRDRRAEDEVDGAFEFAERRDGYAALDVGMPTSTRV